MKTTVPSLLLLGALIASASGAPAPKQNHSENACTERGEWSEPVNGLSARLLLTLEEIKVNNHPYFRYKVVLETKNVQGNVLAVSSQPSFVDVEIRDADGKEVRDRGYEQSGPIPLPQWAHVPSTAYLGVRVDMTTVGLPGGSALVGIDGYVRFLKPGTYSVRATIAAKKDKEGPDNQWLGEMKLRPVTITFNPVERSVGPAQGIEGAAAGASARAADNRHAISAGVKND